MCQINFIAEFNSFMQYAKDNGLTAHERLLWIALFKIANDRAKFNAQMKAWDWDTDFIPVSNAEMELYSTLNRKAIEDVRNKLKQRGLIDFVSGKRAHMPQYKICYFTICGENADGIAVNFGHNSRPVSDAISDQFPTNSSPSYKYKDKGKKDDDNATVNQLGDGWYIGLTQYSGRRLATLEYALTCKRSVQVFGPGSLTALLKKAKAESLPCWMLTEAIERTCDRHDVSGVQHPVDYAARMISNWLEEGISTEDELRAADEEWRMCPV